MKTLIGFHDILKTLQNARFEVSWVYIPVIIQNASFALLLFAPTLLKKIRNRAGYYSFFSAA